MEGQFKGTIRKQLGEKGGGNGVRFSRLKQAFPGAFYRHLGGLYDFAPMQAGEKVTSWTRPG